MNKQEAIEEILKNNHTKLGLDFDDEVRVTTVIDVINQIDEPEKPVIPQFVADYIKYAKTTFCSLKETIYFDEIYIYNYANWSRDKVKLISWMSIEENQEIFAKAWLFGYEIEQEKLYTVEIPNPESVYPMILYKTDGGGVILGTCYTPDNWKKLERNQLTETEIRKDFEWAWQWAKPVEE